MATYALGDIHGCYDSLRRLLDFLRFDPAQDRLWIVGDVVNRGPKSLEVLRFVRSMEAQVVLIIGNHDLHFLAACRDRRPAKPRDTFPPLLAAPDRDELVDWVRRQPLAYANDDFLMVHAGLMPEWSDDDALDLGREVEEVLRSDGWESALTAFYGEGPAHWSPDLTGKARLHAIVQGLTRIRYVDAAGARAKGQLGPAWEAGPDRIPWFLHPNQVPRRRTVLFGHWSTLGLYSANGVVGLDTGCVYRRHLTALRLEDRAIFQVPADD